MMRSRCFYAAFALALCFGAAEGWWCTGHLLVAQIAKNTMDPADVGVIDGIFEDLGRNGPFPNSADLVNGACWCDDLKEFDLGVMEGWHFADQPYFPTSYRTTVDNQVENVISTINQLATAAMVPNQRPWLLQFALGNLVHNYGDIHQPLHAVSMYASHLPHGDAGGNFIHVTIDGQKANLHKIWDSICWTTNWDWPRPLAPENMAWVQNKAQEIMLKMGPNITQENRTVTDPQVMAQESFQAAVDYVYPGVQNYGTITQQYLDTCLPVAEMRIALGGYRLGTILTQIAKKIQGK